MTAILAILAAVGGAVIVGPIVGLAACAIADRVTTDEGLGVLWVGAVAGLVAFALTFTTILVAMLGGAA